MVELEDKDHIPKQSEENTIAVGTDDEETADNNKSDNHTKDETVESAEKLIAVTSSNSNPLRFSLPGVQWISQPLQRQRWGDKQVLPHVNWGDIFFDLFYVAAAYNLAKIISYEPSWMGLMYFAGCFGPIAMSWEDKTVYDARFAVVEDSIFHRAFEVGQILLVGTSVSHIRPYSELSNSYSSYEMFGFSVGITLVTLMTILRYAELLIWPSSPPAAKSQAKRSLLIKIPSLCCFLVACIVSGVNFYKIGDSNTTDRSLAGSDDSTSSGKDSHAPIIFCLVGYFASALSNILYIAWSYTQPWEALFAKSVPINVDFIIHRYGEWIMLMLGESILSILIVDTSIMTGYYFSFYISIVSVVLLQYLHFRSQPHNADEHAMRRSRKAGIIWAYIMNVYSACLIIIGVSYKMLLDEFSDYKKGDAQVEKIAIFFSAGLAISMLCSDWMILSHRGLNYNVKRCKCPIHHHYKKGAILIIVCRFAIFMTTTFVHRITKVPGKLIFVGFWLILAQVLVRYLGDIVFPEKFCEDTPQSNGKNSASHSQDDVDENMWPNTTYAQAERKDLRESLRA